MSGCWEGPAAALALALTSAAAADGVASAPVVPGIRAPAPARFVVELGRLDPPFGAPVRAEVPVRNGSGSAVSIGRAVPHCGACTRVTGVPVRLEPGAEARVGIVFEPGPARGRVRFGCTLLGSDGPWAIADVEATVPGIDAGRSGSVELGTIEAGIGEGRAFEVRTFGPPGAWLDCDAAEGGLEADARPEGDASHAGGGMTARRWLVRVRVPLPGGCGTVEGTGEGGDAATARRLGSVRLDLRDGRSVIESRTVAINGRRWSPAAARPHALFLGCLDGLASVVREVSLPPGDGVPEADGAEVAGFRRGPPVRCSLRIAVPPARGTGWRVVRGEVALRRGTERWTIPWLGFAGLGATEDAASLPDLGGLVAVLEFRRDAILASTSSFRERTEIAGELVRCDDPSVAGQGLRIDRFVHRAHDGPLRVTAVRARSRGGATEEAVASDGSIEVRRTGDGALEVRPCSDHASHRDPAEWEAVGGLAGSLDRGTALGPCGDLARELSEAGPARVAIGWDAGALPGLRAIRVDALGASFGSVWLDPSLGLAPVLRDAEWTDGRVADRSRWFAGHFLRTAEGIDLPAVVRVMQRRSSNPGAGSSRMEWRTVFDQTLTCARFTIDDPSPARPWPLAEELSLACSEAGRDWSSIGGGIDE